MKGIRPAKTSLPAKMNPRAGSDPYVSVVLPTHNRAELVGRAIRSVLEQTFRDFELVIVDDGSTDETPRVLAALTGPRIRTFRLPGNSGVSRARNAGLAHARGEWIALLDDDDEWLPRKIEAQLERVDATNDPQIGAVYCSFKVMSPEGEEEPFNEARLAEGQILRDLMWPGQVVTPATYMLKRSALFEVGGFDESFEAVEDRDCWLRLASAGYHFVAVPEPLTLVHRAHGPSMSSDAVVMTRGLARYHRRWDPIAKRELPTAEYQFTLTSRRLMLERFHRKQLKRLLRRGSRRRARRYARSIAPVVPAYPWLWPFVWRALVVALLGRGANRFVGGPPQRGLKLAVGPVIRRG